MKPGLPEKNANLPVKPLCIPLRHGFTLGCLDWEKASYSVVLFIRDVAEYEYVIRGILKKCNGNRYSRGEKSIAMSTRQTLCFFRSIHSLDRWSQDKKYPFSLQHRTLISVTAPTGGSLGPDRRMWRECWWPDMPMLSSALHHDRGGNCSFLRLSTGKHPGELRNGNKPYGNMPVENSSMAAVEVLLAQEKHSGLIILTTVGMDFRSRRKCLLSKCCLGKNWHLTLYFSQYSSI